MKRLLKIYKIVIISILFCEPLFAQNEYIINQIIKERDTINFITLSSNYEEKKATILFIQGSKSIPVIFSNNGTKKINLPFDYKKYLSHFNFVVINRKGTPIISEFELVNEVINKPSVVYTKNDNLFYRENQVRKVIKYLRNRKWVDKNRLYIIGHSEGYRVAAKASENNQFIKKLVCMSADPINRITEKIVILQTENLQTENDSINTQKILNNIDDFKSIGIVNDYKDDFELYNWSSYEKFMPIKSLLNYDNPLLVVYGSNDNKAFNNYLLPFILNKSNLKLKIYPDLDHNFFRKEFDKEGKPLEDSYHWDRVFKDVVDWLLNE